jgi:C4-dicarboxylate transporter DctQ subunit
MKFIKKIDNLLTKFEEYSITILLMTMTAVTFWGVINRFFLKNSLSWSEELSRYLSIWATFIGASLGVKKGAHIGVEALVIVLPVNIRKNVDIFTDILSFLFCIGIAITGYNYGLKLIGTGQLSPAMRIPISYAYAAIPFGMILMSIRYIIAIANKISPIEKSTRKEVN